MRTQQHRAAQRIETGPQDARGRLVDDDHLRPRGDVVGRDGASARDLNAHGTEVVRRDGPQRHDDLVLRRGGDRGAVLPHDRDGVAEAGQRQAEHRAGRLDAGHGPRPLERAGHEVGPQRRRRVARIGQGQRRRQHPIAHLEAARHGQHAGEAARQRDGAHGEHHGQGDLGGDQRRAGAAVGSRAAAVVAGQPCQAAGAPGRHHADRQGRQQRDRGDDRQHQAVEARLGQQRHLRRRLERHDAPHAEPRQRRAAESAGHGQHQRLGQRTANQAPRAGAECHAQRQVVRAPERPRQHQTGDVHAHDQQHEAGRCEQHDERRPDVADQCVAEREQAHAASVVGAGVGRGQTSGDGRQLGLGLRHRRLGAEPPDHVEVLRAALGGELGRREGERHPRFGLERMRQTRPQDPDDFPRHAVDGDRRADQIRRAREPSRPQRVAHDHHRRGSGAGVLGRDDAAAKRSKTGDGEEAAGDRRAWHLFRRQRARHREGLARDRGHRLEPAGAGLPVGEVGGRRRGPQGRALRRRRADRDQAVGAGERQRPQQHRVDRAEDGGVGADADREREHRHGREGRLAQQGPRRNPEVVGPHLQPPAVPSQPGGVHDRAEAPRGE